MKTYLGEKVGTVGGFSIQKVLYIEECVGKRIKTSKDYIVDVHTNGTLSKENTHEANLKDEVLIVEDIVRSCGLYLYCRTEDNRTLCINPEDLEIFEEV